MKIRKAVITAAGWGTRFLPLSKSVPKELLPLVDKPIIQYAVEEAVACDIELVVIVISQGKTAIENYFMGNAGLEHVLEQKKQGKLLESLRTLTENCKGLQGSIYFFKLIFKLKIYADRVFPTFPGDVPQAENGYIIRLFGAFCKAIHRLEYSIYDVFGTEFV